MNITQQATAALPLLYGAVCAPQEMNEHDQRCRFLQVWLTPDRRGHTPQYGSSTYTKADRHNQLLHVLSGVGPAPAWQGVNRRGCIALHADANVFVSENDAGVQHQLELGASRQAYLVCMEGAGVLALCWHTVQCMRGQGGGGNCRRVCCWRLVVAQGGHLKPWLPCCVFGCQGPVCLLRRSSVVSMRIASPACPYPA